MEVWTIEWWYPHDGENNITVWADEYSALLECCNEIKGKIAKEWNMKEVVDIDFASDFNAHLEVGTVEDLHLAIEIWNDYQNEYNAEKGEWYSILKYQVLGGVNGAPTTSKSTVAGATCRGPCKQLNEYAYADQSDGTYICHQCTTFQRIFASN